MDNNSNVSSELMQANIRFPLVDFKKEFNPLLLKRFYPLVRWFANDLDDNDDEQQQEESKENDSPKILLFINILDRSSAESIKEESLVYAGIDALFDLVKDKQAAPKIANLDKVITDLLTYKIKIEDSIEGGRLYKEFKDGDLELSDLEVGRLSSYYDRYLSDGEFKNKGQELEFPIIDALFDLDSDMYISLPLIQFGDFDGVVHIIFEERYAEKFSKKSTKKALIRQFSLEYEGVLLDWDIVGDNMQRKSTLPLQLEYLTSEIYEKAITTNPIFRECRYKGYYQDSRPYFLKRIEISDSVPEFIKNEHRKRAIISILIDSYAHNISAHSLTVLKWWFQQRASSSKELQEIEKTIERDIQSLGWWTELSEYLNHRFGGEYSMEEIEQGIRRDLARWINIVERRMQPGKYLPVRDQFLPLAKQLHPLFRFLLEKGAFWSGITRDQQFGGEIVNLYDILWNDFINNPLYLGTIAYSEGITRLNLNIRFYTGTRYEVDKPDDFERTYTIEKDRVTGTPLTGRFATISVAGKKEKSFTHEYLNYKGEGFENHDLLVKRLQECEVFFPGGVVGKHAFFTLIENEIRNVKHYPEKDLEEMRKHGLDLFIGIRPGSLSTGKEKFKPLQDKQLYKIGVWIGHQTKLVDQKGHLVAKRLQLLKEDIITKDTNRARLGGNYQDKICAAMLFNNNFISVEKQDTDRDKNYYPWLRSAYSQDVDKRSWKEIDYEVRKRNLEKAVIDLKNQDKHPKKGYFKKYFHLWQGKQIYHLTDANILKLENVSRFKLVTVEEEAWKKTVRSNGVVRVLPALGTLSWTEAYHKWLLLWFKKPKYNIEIKRGATTVGHLIFDEKHANYYPTDYMLDHEEETQKYVSSRYSKHQLKFAHGDKAAKEELMLSVRSHGVLANYFFDKLESINDFDKATIENSRAYELLEVLQTKVCVFDKRIAERVEDKTKRQYLDEQLHCGIYWEDLSKWEEVKKEGFSNYHFIIVHLSFIETMVDKDGNKYGEEGIVRFLDEQVGDQLSDNCIFVVTTGRGREEWWRKIEDSPYAAYTTFRPVEMLIEAVEIARLKQDDIDLKYNLIKVLFGS